MWMVLRKCGEQNVEYTDLFVRSLQCIWLVFILGSKSECYLLFLLLYLGIHNTWHTYSTRILALKLFNGFDILKLFLNKSLLRLCTVLTTSTWHVLYAFVSRSAYFLRESLYKWMRLLYISLSFPPVVSQEEELQ